MSTFQRTFAVGAIALGGCGAADESHPTSAAQSSKSETSLSVDSNDSNPSCTPNEIRECRHYYKDEHGQLQCPLGVQQCTEYGVGWSECGSSVPRPDAGTALGTLE